MRPYQLNPLYERPPGRDLFVALPPILPTARIEGNSPLPQNEGASRCVPTN